MKKFLSVILILAFAVTMSLVGISCKTTTGGNFKVRWYVKDGVKVVEVENEKHLQWTFRSTQPENGEPTSEELKQLAIDFDPYFFTESPLNEMVYLINFPGGEDFRMSLMGKGYDHMVNLLTGFEVIPGLFYKQTATSTTIP